MKFIKLLSAMLVALVLFGCQSENAQVTEEDFSQGVLTYDYQNTSVGQEVSIQGDVHTVVKVPVVNNYDGEVYEVTFPSDSETGELYISGASLNDVDITPNNYAPSELVYIGDYPAILVARCNITVLSQTQVSSSFCQADLYIKINSMYVVIQVGSLDVLTEVSLNKVGGDYTSSVTYPSVEVYNPIPYIDDFIDHMKIEKVVF